MIFHGFAPCRPQPRPVRPRPGPNPLPGTMHGSATHTAGAEPRAFASPNATGGRGPGRTSHDEWPARPPKRLGIPSIRPLPRPAKTPRPGLRPQLQHLKGLVGDRLRVQVRAPDRSRHSVEEANQAVVLHPTPPSDGDVCGRPRRDPHLREATSPTLPKCATPPGPGSDWHPEVVRRAQRSIARLGGVNPPPCPMKGLGGPCVRTIQNSANQPCQPSPRGHFARRGCLGRPVDRRRGQCRS